MRTWKGELKFEKRFLKFWFAKQERDKLDFPPRKAIVYYSVNGVQIFYSPGEEHSLLLITVPRIMWKWASDLTYYYRSVLGLWKKSFPKVFCSVMRALRVKPFSEVAPNFQTIIVCRMCLFLTGERLRVWGLRVQHRARGQPEQQQQASKRREGCSLYGQITS